MNAKQVIEQAIDRSIRRNEIVTLDRTPELTEVLLAECDDCISNTAYDVDEYWGARDDGEEWRVHLRILVPESLIRRLKGQ